MICCSCKLGFPVQGVFKNVDYSDVNTVCRSHNRQILASGDDDQLVNLYKYPCIAKKPKCKEYVAHSSHVTRVRFAPGDSHLISIGGNDKCVIVWETDFGDNKEEEEEGDNEAVEDDGESISKKKVKQKKQVEATHESTHDEDEDFPVEETKHGDEFTAVKPWLGAIKAPSDFKTCPPNQEKPPAVKIELEYVHGYRAKDCRNNLRYNKNGDLVYNAAALGIVLDVETNTQKFFDKHKDDITAIEVHPDGVRVATGELGPKPTIYIWNSETMLPLVTLTGGVIKGIACMSFSPSGAKLGAACIDDNHMIGVFDVESGTLEGVEKGDTAIILAMAHKNDKEFVTVGPKHFKAWTSEGKSLKAKKGQFGDANNLLNCVMFNKEEAVVGASNGEVQIWSGNSLAKKLAIHKQAVDALFIDDDKYILTGGKDCMINILSKTNYRLLCAIDCQKLIPNSLCPKIRSVALSRDEASILLGTFGSEIFELSTGDKEITTSTKWGDAKNIMQGHYTPNAKWTNEVWGLAIFHSGEKWATCSDDGTLRIWSVEERKMLDWFDLNTDMKGKLSPDKATQDLAEAGKGRSLDIIHDDSLIAIGFKEGTVKIVDLSTMKYVTILKNRQRWIETLKFSPDGTMLAVGSHDDFIDVYTVPKFGKKWSMKKHSSFITHIDWSTNSQNLHSTCGAYELLFWDANTGKQLTGGATALRDEKWANWTVVLGWPVQGIWPQYADGSDINACDRTQKTHSGGYQLIATGDDKSQVRILRYPSIKKNSDGVVGRGHSSHVTCVRWSPDDERLFSSGGEDNCVFQWKVAEL